MRLLKSKPGNKDFHSEHGRNLSPYYLVANIGQLLSAASLALAVFSILRDAIAGRGMSVATGGIVTAAILIGIFIELANRTLARPSIKPIVTKNQFADNPDAALRHKTITRWSRAGLFLVGGLSLVLSFMGSMDAGKMIGPEPPPAPLDSLNNVATGATQDVYATFTNDTTVLLQPFRLREQAAAQQFSATKAERTKAAQDYVGCANRGNGYCKKMKRGILADIDEAEAAYNATLSTIAIERGATLTEALQRRDAALNEATGKSDAAILAANTKADREATEADKKKSKNGYIFGVLTFAGQMVFYLMFYLILTIEAGSEITEDLEPNEFHALPTVASDFKAVVSHRVERGARRLMAHIFGQRERLDKPLPYISLYPDNGIDETDAASVMKAEGIAPELTESEAIAANHAPGFYQAKDDPHAHARNAMRNGGNASPLPSNVKTGDCPNCNNVFVKNTTWQKYCNTECRIDFNAKKNGGKRFDPQFRNKKKKK